MERENQRIVLTKRLLKEAILRLLKKKELKQITVTELCAEADINRVTFYRHYETPRDVLEDVCRDLFRDMQQKLKPPTSLQDFERYLEDMCTYLYERSDTMLLLIRRSSDMEAFEFIKELYRTLIEEHDTLPQLREYDTDSIRLMSTYFGGGGYFLLRQWLTEDIQKSPREVAALVYQLTCNPDLIAARAKKLLESGAVSKRK